MQKPMKIVCFGGGTGLPTLLEGLRDIRHFDIAAIVTMFDSGGSSGRLRDKHGILPPSDYFRCLMALSRKPYARQVLSDRDSDEQAGHTLGNLLMLGALQEASGDLVTAIRVMRRRLAVQGHVHPVTTQNSTLCAHLKNGTTLRKENIIDKTAEEINDLFLDPPVTCSQEAIVAIREADILCIGPGSFYTSLLPNFLPQGITQAVQESKAPIIFILNLLTEGLGMQGYTARRIVSILESTLGRTLDRILMNTNIPQSLDPLYAHESKYPIEYDITIHDPRYIHEDLWFDGTIARHDVHTLAAIVYRICRELLG